MKFSTFVVALIVGLAPSDSDWHVSPTPEITSQEVRFSNANANLVGTVYFPKSGDRMPAVVVLHEASSATREDAVYRHLRDGLPALGFAVLIYDRRGSGQSSGDARSVDYETLADDAIAAQGALAKLPRIDPTRIGFWGLSQGGWLAVLAAGRSRNAAFAISVSAPLVTADQQMQFAMSNLLTVRGYAPADVREMVETRKAWTGYLRGTNSREVAVMLCAKLSPNLGSTSVICLACLNSPWILSTIRPVGNWTTIPSRRFCRPKSRCCSSTEDPIPGFQSHNLSRGSSR
jgi:dienelactone hydrolase